jgi:hypothetical protein
MVTAESTNSRRNRENDRMAESPRRDEQLRQAGAAITGGARFVGAVFGIAFFGIGLTVIIALWGGGMGDPPVFFKLFGSLIALVFVAMGGAMAFGAITGGGILSQGNTSETTTATTTTTSSAAPAGYTCPHCGGGLDRNADVSPMGDVKCSFCGRWFNVHGRR